MNQNKSNQVSNATELYNEDYYERGVFKGISGYMNFSWLPELTIRMAHYFINEIPIQKTDKVLDFGCAKGFIVKALRLLDIDAYGVDVSKYAIDMVDSSVREYCKLISGARDVLLFERKYDLMIAKDVFEHLEESDLLELLATSKRFVNKMFVVVPLSSNDCSGKYIIPEYDNDVTHILAKSKSWWRDKFECAGWSVSQFRHSFTGCKENWTMEFQDGNGFYILENKDLVC